MPRYDDRYGNTRLYVGHLSSRTRSRDLNDLFSRYGRVRDVDLKNDFAFVEFSDPRDADDARHSLNGREFDGSRIIVEVAKGGPRGAGGSREYLGRGPPPGSGRCFNCGLDGHWARDCKAGDWKNKCYRCGEKGHIERSCQNSPKDLRRGRSYSRSASRSPPTRRERSRSRSCSYSRSRSPLPAKRSRRSIEREEQGSRSPAYSGSPQLKGTPPRQPKGRDQHADRSRSRSRSPSARLSPPSKQHDEALDCSGSEYSGSPKRGRTSGSPVSQDGSNRNGYNRPSPRRGDESPEESSEHS